MGRWVSDPDGEPVGTVVDTWPYDGGGEVEMVVVRLGRFDQRRMLPAGSLVADLAGGLRTPFAREQVEDAPALDDGRYAAAADERAMSHWSFVEPPRTGTLTRRWQRSSGSSATARRSPTSPSRITTAS
jgi:hypothetical protein